MPATFDFDTLNNFPTLRKRVAYARANLKEVGKGSSRIVFLLPGEIPQVLKLALNKKGRAQNKVEGRAEWNEHDCVAKVYERSNDFSWLAMEACKSASKDSIVHAL